MSRKMTRDEALAFLAAGSRTAKVATTRADGRPHVAPVWFVVDGDDLVFTTHETTVKGRTLLRDGRAAVAVEDDTYPFAFVLVEGPVSINPAAADLTQWCTRIAARYVPARQAEAFGRRNAVAGELLVRLRAQRLVGEDDVAGPGQRE